jgi:hypothetical protein
MDIKRTILWVIFSMSLVLLYDNWQRANGHASMFFPSANTQQAAPAGAVALRLRPTCPRRTRRTQPLERFRQRRRRLRSRSARRSP